MMARYLFLGSFFSLALLLTTACSKKSAAPVVVDKANPEENVEQQDQSSKITSIVSALKSKSLERRSGAIKAIVQYDASSAVPVLLDALNDGGVTDGAISLGEPNSTREAAVLALKKLGQPGEIALTTTGLKTLIDGLQDPAPAVREHTAYAISLLGNDAKPAITSLVKLCADANEPVRHAAYSALDRIKNAPAGAIAELLKHSDPKVAFDAARALNGMKSLPKSIIPTLVAVLQSPKKRQEEGDEPNLIRLEIAEILANFGKDAQEAIPALVGVLQTTQLEDFLKYYRPRPGDDPNSARNDESPAMMALRKIGKPAVPALVELLNNKSALVRWQAASVLAGIGPDAKEALPSLQNAFDEEFKRQEIDLSVVATTALAQVLLGADPVQPVGKVAEILKDDDDVVRLQTVRILARFGRQAESAVPALIPLLDDRVDAIKFEVTNTLRAIGPGAKAAIPALGKKLADDVPEVRRNAAIALKSLGPVAAEVTPALAKLLDDKDEALRRDVIETIISIGPAAREAVPALTKRISSTDQKEQLLALEALGVIGKDAGPAVGDIVKLLDHREEVVRFAAIKALGRMGVATPTIVKALAGKLKDARMKNRVAAARALAMLGPEAKAAETPLRQFGGINAKYPNPLAEIWSAVALFRLGISADTNLKIVLDALKDKSPAGKSKRLAVIDAADLLGPAAKSVLPELIDALKEKTPVSSDDPTPVRQRVVVALGTMGPAAKDAVPKITALLKENDPNLKRSALIALGQIGPAADFASARLREIIRTEPAYAEAAREALDKIEKK